MAKIRNISPDALTVGFGFPGRRISVAPDEVFEVPDDILANYVECVDGDKTIPSDLWVEVADIAPPIVLAPEAPKE